MQKFVPSTSRLQDDSPKYTNKNLVPSQSTPKDPVSHLVHLSPTKFPRQEHIPFESHDNVDPLTLQLQSRKVYNDLVTLKVNL